MAATCDPVSHPTVGWRTLLFVPAGDERKLASARRSGADALILDLEDAILEEAKAGAREWLTRLPAAPADGAPPR